MNTSTIPHARALKLLAEVMRQPKKRRIGILGLGISGTAMALYFAHRGAQIYGADQRLEIPDTLRQAVDKWPIILRLGPTPPDVFNHCDAIAISPGIDPKHPVIQEALARNIPVFGELELQVPLPSKALAITGTNGKSTTTALAGALLDALGYTTFVGGNLGQPIATWLDQHQPTDAAVLELSSYQLDSAYRFCPDVGVVLNVTADHLERYGSMQAYAASKQRLVQAVPKNGRLILNWDDTWVRAMHVHAQAPIWWFSTHAQATLAGANGIVYDADKDRFVGYGNLAHWQSKSLAHPRLLGAHNRQNAMAAMLGVLALMPQLSPDALYDGYVLFQGLPHRLEWIGNIDGVDYINDSKATNDAAAAIAVRAMQKPVVLLAGGVDKGGGYQQLVAACAAATVHQVIAYGQAAPVIQAAFEQDGRTPVTTATELQAALAQARQSCRTGDVILLAPACSSFDAFNDYQHRGQMFKTWVLQHRKGAV